MYRQNANANTAPTGERPRSNSLHPSDTDAEDQSDWDHDDEDEEEQGGESVVISTKTYNNQQFPRSEKTTVQRNMFPFFVTETNHVSLNSPISSVFYSGIRLQKAHNFQL